jgi:hypothetical protein
VLGGGFALLLLYTAASFSPNVLQQLKRESPHLLKPDAATQQQNAELQKVFDRIQRKQPGTEGP